MAPSRRSPKRKSVPRCINTNGPLNAIGLGIRSDLRSAIGNATMTIFPPLSSRKSSLRSGCKTPSPDANRVRFAEVAYTAPRSTPRTGSKTTTSPKTTGKLDAQTTQVSPTFRFSPRTATKAQKAAKATLAKTIEQQTEFINTRLISPPPVSSKNFLGTGNKVGSGLPPTPPLKTSVNDRNRTPAPSAPGTGLPTPPRTDTTTPMGSPRSRTITITESPSHQRQFYIDGVSDWLSGPSAPRMQLASDKPAIEISTKALLEHMHDLKQNLRPLTLEEIHIQFYLLQKMLRQFSKKYFNQKWSELQTASFSLADLTTEQPAFYRMMAYIADGSTFQNGWQDFLTSEHTRPHIVYGILSEWLKYNVFGHSCFGLSKEEDAAMTAIDIWYLKWDGFVRTKERAKLLMRILDNKPAWEQEMDMSLAVEAVVQDLMVVLVPILPEGCIGELQKQLHALVDLAANLHQCIRLTGINGTILRFHSSSKGDQFAYTARQNCANKSTVTKTIDDMIIQRNMQHAVGARSGNLDSSANGHAHSMEHFARIKDKLVIKMPCFPLVLAVVPYGPTLRDFAVEQDMYEKIIRPEDLPPLQSKGPMYIEDIPAEIVRAACFEEMPESCHEDYETRMQKGKKRSKAFGSYVRQYVLNESDVYCEWDFPEDRGIGKRFTLRHAVERAQREKYGYVPAERRKKRKRIARNATYVTGAGVAAAALYGIAHHTGITNAAMSAVKNLNLSSKFSVEDIKGAVSSAMNAAGAKTNVFRQAASRPFRITKYQATKWISVQLAGAHPGASKWYDSTVSFAAKLKSAANSFKPKISAKAFDLSSVANTSILKEVVLSEEIVELTLTTRLLSSISRPASTQRL